MFILQALSPASSLVLTEDNVDPTTLGSDILHALLALTGRFIPGLEGSSYHHSQARVMTMTKVAQGNIDLSTIQSMCILSYAFCLGMLDHGY